MSHEWILPKCVRDVWGGDRPPEQPLIDWSSQFLSPDKVSLDIGGHVGDWAVTMAQHSKTVHVFEPQRRAYGLAVANCAPYKNVHVHNVALGATHHIGRLYSNGCDLDGGTSLSELPLHGMGWPGSVPGDEAVVRTLDEFLIDNISFIKLDVEGGELNVIKGALKTLERSGWPPFIFESWHFDWALPLRVEIVAYVESLGYRLQLIANWHDTYLATRS